MRAVLPLALVVLSGCAAVPLHISGDAGTPTAMDWDHAHQSALRYASMAAMVGQNPTDAYRSQMRLACERRSRLVDPVQRVRSDAECDQLLNLESTAYVTARNDISR